MRCFINDPFARERNTTYNMIRIGDLALAFLLLVTTFSGYGDAARSREQRRAVEDPYLVSPPGVWPNDNVRPPSKDLGERVFVSRIRITR